MPGFRLVVDPGELTADTDPKVLDPHNTVYDADRGNRYPTDEDDSRRFMRIATFE
ncbi:hypothetical protein [Streptomyces cadmiisoli]|uniref:hypothetical protein n=1 Tax=Streptomyces cadmiisoli TaxID=2184053 RepID=UPI00366A015E